MPGEGYQFVNMLLNKKARQADIDLANRQAQQQQIQNALQSAGNMALMLKSSQNSSKQDGIANALMNKSDAPRAEAVNPNAPGVASANAVYGGASQPHSGGMDELKLSMAMDANKNKNIASNLAALKYSNDSNFRERQLAETITHNRAIEAAKNAPTKFKDKVLSSDAYYRGMQDFNTAINNSLGSGDYQQYKDAALGMQVLHAAATASGLKFDPPSIPEFTPDGSYSDSQIAQLRSELNLNQGKPVAYASDDERVQNYNWAKAHPQMPVPKLPADFKSDYGPGARSTISANGAAPPSQPSGNSAVVAQAKQAIASGANPQAVSARLKAMGIDPAILTR